MDFSDILNDLKKLEGICLNSIRPGAEITITDVDFEQKKVMVRSSSGKIQSKSFDNQINEGAEYSKKTKDVNDQLKKLF